MVVTAIVVLEDRVAAISCWDQFLLDESRTAAVFQTCQEQAEAGHPLLLQAELNLCSIGYLSDVTENTGRYFSCMATFW
jgi:hypothetical protein